MTGYIYCGYYDSKRIHGYFKIGTTSQTVGRRASQIRHTSGNSSFTISRYIKIENIDKSDLLFIEGYVRNQLKKVDGITYDNSSNDHFCFRAENHADMQKKAEVFSEYVVQFTNEAIKLL